MFEIVKNKNAFMCYYYNFLMLFDFKNSGVEVLRGIWKTVCPYRCFYNCVSVALQVNCPVNSGTELASSKTDGRLNPHSFSLTLLGNLGYS